MKIHGFSLIELLVVIAIISLLAGVAVPVYKSYKLRSQLTSSLAILNSMANSGIVAASKNNSLSTLQFGNKQLWGINEIDSPPIVNVGYWQASDVGLSYPDLFVICAYVSGLEGIDPQYMAPTPAGTLGQNGQKSAMCMKVTEEGEVYTKVCGSFSGSIYDIPPEYAPAGCNCANVSTGEC